VGDGGLELDRRPVIGVERTAREALADLSQVAFDTADR
jgi:hypothetical protein